MDSDDPLDECPCAVAEAEGRDIPCTENEECPYYGIEFPEFSEEDKERIKEHALRGLRMRAGCWDTPTPPKMTPDRRHPKTEYPFAIAPWLSLDFPRN